MLSINTNLSAQNAANQISSSQKNMASSMEKLTTGERINRAADDVAGSALSSRFETFQNRTDQFISNANNGISMIQTFDGALKQSDSLIQRMKVLATQAQNGTNTTTDTGLIQQEFDQLVEEVTRNSSSASYNGINMLDTASAGSTYDIAVGLGASNVVSLTGTDMSATGLGIDAITLDQADADTWQTAVHDVLDTASSSVNDLRANLGSVQNRLSFAVDNLSNVSENTSAALSNMRDTDFASETATLAKEKVLAATAQAMLKQANEQTQSVQQLVQ